ncbi:glycoside hydrolase [Sphingobacterium faecium]|uniref:C40 family peptidase n=1 Tax=Sphingobacterium faecium TaxID=34087 RepID=UPI001290B699|nr:NlpC/P60 family protein [Sphingobacterium faecium]MQP30146.1 glycoside hydrolase [Sphingobacterium faecium]
MCLKRNLLFFISLLLLFSSCSVKKKTNNYGRGNAVLTDASEARGIDYSKSSLDSYADLLHVKRKELNPNLYSFIDEWMGIPHRMGGATKKGVDCSGFVGMLYLKVYKEDLPRSSRDMSVVVKNKRTAQLKEGDLVFFSFGGRNIDHVGVYLHNNKFVHVSTKKGVIISDLADSWYSKYFTNAGSPKS